MTGKIDPNYLPPQNAYDSEEKRNHDTALFFNAICSQNRGDPSDASAGSPDNGNGNGSSGNGKITSNRTDIEHGPVDNRNESISASKALVIAPADKAPLNIESEQVNIQQPETSVVTAPQDAQLVYPAPPYLQGLNLLVDLGSQLVSQALARVKIVQPNTKAADSLEVICRNQAYMDIAEQFVIASEGIAGLLSRQLNDPSYSAVSLTRMWESRNDADYQKDLLNLSAQSLFSIHGNYPLSYFKQELIKIANGKMEPPTLHQLSSYLAMFSSAIESFSNSSEKADARTAKVKNILPEMINPLIVYIKDYAYNKLLESLATLTDQQNGRLPSREVRDFFYALSKIGDTLYFTGTLFFNTDPEALTSRTEESSRYYSDFMRIASAVLPYDEHFSGNTEQLKSKMFKARDNLIYLGTLDLADATNSFKTEKLNYHRIAGDTKLRKILLRVNAVIPYYIK